MAGEAEILRIVLVVLAGAIGGLWLLLSFLFRVSGEWERALTDEERDSGGQSERIHLAQFGPMVTGRRDIPGGFQEFSGFVLGRKVRLKRRERGVQALCQQGFPEGVAKKLDGEVTAHFVLTLAEGSTYLRGYFVPFKIDFTHQPPRITAMKLQAPEPRTYRRVVPLPDKSPARELAGEPS